MKTWTKRILISLVLAVIVAVIGLAIFLLTFDPNAYKYKLEELIKARYDRTLVIDGEIELSLFPRIGLALRDVSLSEAGSSETFASIKSARLAVAIWPLLSNYLVVDHVAIDGLKAKVIRNKDGHFNFANLVGEPISSLGQGAAPAAAESGGGAQGQSFAERERFQIDIAGMNLQHGQILVQDQITGRAIAINDFNANTGRVTFNQPFNLTLNGHIEGGDPRVDSTLNGQALLTLDPANENYAAQKLDLRIVGLLPDVQARSLVARGNVAFDGKASALNVSGLELIFQGDITNPLAPMKNVEASIVIPKLWADAAKRQLQIDRLALRVRGALESGPFELAVDAPALNISPDRATGQALTGRIRLDGQNAIDTNFGLTGISGNASELDIQEAKLNASIKQGERLLKLAFSTPLSLNLMQRQFVMSALRGEVKITDAGLPKGSLQIPVIGSVGADFLKDQATANINAVLEGGKFDLSATLMQLTAQPRLDFKLAVDTLDLDKLAPSAPAPVSAAAPFIARAAAGTTQPAAVAQAPAATAAKTVPPPAPAAPAASVASPSAPAAATAGVPADTSIDLSILVGPIANGGIKIRRLVVRGLKADDVSADLKLENGKLDFSTLTASLYEGTMAGVLSIDAKDNNKTATRLSLSGVAIDPLLTDLTGQSPLTGRGSVVLDLKTAGANTYAMKKALSGTAQLHLRDGRVKAINVAQALRDLKNVLHGAGGAVSAVPGTAAQTDFTALDVDMAFADGVGTIKSANLATPVLRITQGDPARIDLLAGTVDAVALIKIVNTAGQNGKSLVDSTNMTIPVKIVGPLEKPVYSVQSQGLAREALKHKVLDKIGSGKVDKNTVRDVGKALKGLLGK